MTNAVLSGILVEFAPVTYPGRIYGKYTWKHGRWHLSDDWIKMERLCKIKQILNNI